jgi:hypothetical protein
MGDVELTDFLSPEEKHASTSRLFEEYFFKKVNGERTPINQDLRRKFYTNLKTDDEFNRFIRNTFVGERDNTRLFDVGGDWLANVFSMYFLPPLGSSDPYMPSYRADERFYGTNFNDGIIKFIISNFKVTNEERKDMLWDILDRVLKETIRGSRGGKTRRTTSNKRRKPKRSKKSRKSGKTKRRRH